jgi:hypothetical protein
MKLYTEEQLKEAIMMARITQGVLATNFFCDEHEVFEKLTPIEIPSDEEIIDIYNELVNFDTDWITGAIYMRDKIQGGNK